MNADPCRTAAARSLGFPRTHRLWFVLAEGTTAPPFTLPDQNGDPVSLEDLRGRWVVFWWFPKAFTAG
jgi:cytochrome oxidase Cu insertion factor (SCO1/SenC/PrrC family)